MRPSRARRQRPASTTTESSSSSSSSSEEDDDERTGEYDVEANGAKHEGSCAQSSGDGQSEVESDLKDVKKKKNKEKEKKKHSKKVRTVHMELLRHTSKD